MHAEIFWTPVGWNEASVSSFWTSVLCCWAWGFSNHISALRVVPCKAVGAEGDRQSGRQSGTWSSQFANCSNMPSPQQCLLAPSSSSTHISQARPSAPLRDKCTSRTTSPLLRFLYRHHEFPPSKLWSHQYQWVQFPHILTQVSKL